MEALNEHLETLAGHVFDNDKLVILITIIYTYILHYVLYIYVYIDIYFIFLFYVISNNLFLGYLQMAKQRVTCPR